MDWEVIKRPSLNDQLVNLGNSIESVKAQDSAKRQWIITLSILDSNNLIYSHYTNELYLKQDSEQVYQALDPYYEKQLVINSMLKHNILIPTGQIKDVIELVKANARMIEKPNTDCIMISDNLYWDKQSGEVVRNQSAPVFYRLFDSSPGDDKLAYIAPFTEEQEKIFWDRYEQVRNELERGEEVERYDFLKTWADGSHDVYMDLHRAHAYMFLKKKPLGSYVLIGIRRNGKSTYLKLTHSIMGNNNTSMVQLGELGDDHKVHELRRTLMNAPDEEEDKAVSAQGFFKTLADHGSTMLSVMRSNAPVRLDCDFMCFFPMNHTPDWKGSGAGACMNRSLIIPFNADLSKFDKTTNNFMQETFTGDVMADYMGSVFAYAWWYHRHDFDFSHTMRREQSTLEQDLDSCITYFKRFVRYFDGFESFKTVYEDYQYWCQYHEVKINSRKELKFVFRNICMNRVSYRKGKTHRSVYRIPAEKQPLFNDFVPTEVEPLQTLHEKQYSLIQQLDNYYEMRGVL